MDSYGSQEDFGFWSRKQRLRVFEIEIRRAEGRFTMWWIRQVSGAMQLLAAGRGACHAPS